MNMAPLPDHIPRALVRDVDTYNLPGSHEDQFLAMKKLQDECPDIFWTPQNGGHWIVTRGEDLYSMFANVDMLSNRRITIPETTYTLPGVSGVISMLPIESDGEAHAIYRRLIQPWFSPKNVKRMSDEIIRPLAIRLVDELKPRGGCEYIEDFAKQLPIIAFLDMMGLPHEDAAYLLPLVEISVRCNDPKEREDATLKMGEYIRENVDARRGKVTNDLMSAVVNARFEDRPATDEEIYGFCFNLLGGGLDTVASTLGFVARFLADSPKHRQQLIERPDRIPIAVEEFLRRFGVGNPAKIIAKDCVYKDIEFKQGDMVLFAGDFMALTSASSKIPWR